MADFFPKHSVIRRVNAEPAIGFGAGRALLLQVAHPLVARGVDEHSEFRRNPLPRLRGTLEAVYSVVFGSEQLARGVGRRIHWIHEHVAGPGYRANDPQNLLWVHATLLETALGCYETLVEPLSDADRATYYDEMCRVVEVFGLPREDQPATIDQFRAYFDEQVRAIEVTSTGRELASFILRPELPARLHVPLAPALSLQRLFTLGMLPGPIRDQLGVDWTADDARRFERARRNVRRTFRATPRAVRAAPSAAAGRVLMALAARNVAKWEARLQATTAGVEAA